MRTHSQMGEPWLIGVAISNQSASRGFLVLNHVEFQEPFCCFVFIFFASCLGGSPQSSLQPTIVKVPACICNHRESVSTGVKPTFAFFEQQVERPKPNSIHHTGLKWTWLSFETFYFYILSSPYINIW